MRLTFKPFKLIWIKIYDINNIEKEIIYLIKIRHVTLLNLCTRYSWFDNHYLNTTI